MSFKIPVANLILNAFRGQPFSLTGLYVGLFTSDPGNDGDSVGHEVVGGSYARVPVSFGDPQSGWMKNTATLTFPKATANWGTVTHVCLCSALTGGQVHISGSLISSVAIVTGQTAQIQNFFVYAVAATPSSSTP